MIGLTCDSIILVFEYVEYEYGDVVLVYIDGRNGEGRLNGFDVIFLFIFIFCYFEYCYMFIYFIYFYIYIVLYSLEVISVYYIL